MEASHSGHHHGHCHAHESTYDKAFFIAILANGLFVIVQMIYAYSAYSTSLLADAVHNLGDVLGLVLAWVATRLMQRKPTPRATYGMKKTSILAALLNGALLIFSCGVIVTQAIYKLMYPSEIHALSVMIVAGMGIFVNGATALLFLRGADDLNIRGAYLHLLYDALVSVGVVIAAVLYYYSKWLWIDPVMGLLIAAVILKGTCSLFADSFRLIIDAVPRSISSIAVSEFFLSKSGVQGIHDLHIWAISTKENVLSVHLYMPDEDLPDTVRKAWVNELYADFDIHQVTIQIERSITPCIGE